MNCPDCAKTKSPQYIPLQKRRNSEGELECPDCGGVVYKGGWISAPKYPSMEYEFNQMMDVRRKSRAVKGRGGVWRNIV